MKTWMIIAIVLVAVGLVLFAVVMTVNRWDFRRLSTHKYDSVEYVIEDAFRNISLKTSAADITLALADDGKCKVTLYENEKMKHRVKVENDTLSIDPVEEISWKDCVGINFETPRITVYLPEKEYTALAIEESTGDITIAGDLSFESMNIDVSTGDVKNYASVKGLVKIETTAGDILTENAAVGAMELKATTGTVTAKNVSCDGNLTAKASSGKVSLTDIRCQGDVQISNTTGKQSLSNIRCGNLSCKGTTGDAVFASVIASEKLSVELNTGDVALESCDGGEIYIKTTTGSVKGSLLSEKIFIANTSTGSVDIPYSTAGGTCEIKTSTGSIKITIGE